MTDKLNLQRKTNYSSNQTWSQTSSSWHSSIKMSSQSWWYQCQCKTNIDGAGAAPTGFHSKLGLTELLSDTVSTPKTAGCAHIRQQLQLALLSWSSSSFSSSSPPHLLLLLLVMHPAINARLVTLVESYPASHISLKVKPMCSICLFLFERAVVLVGGGGGGGGRGRGGGGGGGEGGGGGGWWWSYSLHLLLSSSPASLLPWHQDEVFLIMLESSNSKPDDVVTWHLSLRIQLFVCLSVHPYVCLSICLSVTITTKL